MKWLSLKRITLVLLLVPVISWADASWNDSDPSKDQQTYYAGPDNKKETLDASCKNFCAAYYKGSKTAVSTITDKVKNTSTTSCTCGSKGSATLLDND